METNKRKNKFWLFYHLGMLLFSATAAIIMKYLQTGHAIEPTLWVAVFTIFFTSVFIGYLAIFMVKKAESFSHKQLTRKIIPALLIFYVLAFFIANLFVSLGVLGWYLFNGISLSGFFDQLFHHELNYANQSFFNWLIFFTIAFFYILWMKSAKREQLLVEENLKFRYNTLKSQVNPHFLFNSLNTLSELVYEDAKRADRYIQQLSSIYRYILENEEKDTVPLLQEIEFVQQYFNLQKERDNDKIDLVMDIPHPELYRIIPVSLQLLVENALKHNSYSRSQPLIISIYLQDDCLVVSNPVQRKNILENSTRMGLSNLKERTRLIMKKEMGINAGGSTFDVKLPLRTS